MELIGAQMAVFEAPAPQNPHTTEYDSSDSIQISICVPRGFTSLIWCRLRHSQLIHTGKRRSVQLKMCLHSRHYHLNSIRAHPCSRCCCAQVITSGPWGCISLLCEGYPGSAASAPGKLSLCQA